MATPFRIAALADVHYDKDAHGKHRDLFLRASDDADVLLLAGDLTDYGREEEATLLADDLHAHVSIPILAVLGNHDFESGTPEVVHRVMSEAGVQMLDGTCTEIGGVGFAGTAGFGGGFGQHMLNAWGEPLIKSFVQATLEESLKLEQALSRLETRHRVVLLHYAPIQATVEGEPPAIFPFLGSSRLEAPIDRFEATVVFHGHAHRGAHAGQTAGGVPVYNVSHPVLTREHPDGPGYFVLEVDLDAS